MTEPLRIDLTSKAAESEAVDYTPVPAGKYLLGITECEVARVTSEPKPGKADNRGKPYLKMELTITEGKYEGRKVFSNIMLFGDAFQFVHLLKAFGIQFNGTNFQVEGYEPNSSPTPDWWLGRTFVGGVTIKKGQGTNPKTGEPYPPRNELKGIFPASSWKGEATPNNAVATGASSILP